MPGRRFAFTTEDPPERPADPTVRRENFRRIVRLFRPYKARLAVVCALIVFSAALGVVSPFLLREVLDVAIPEENVGLLTALVAGMVAIPIVTGVIGVWQTLLSNQVGQSVMHDLRSQVYRHLQRLSLAFFTRTRTGEVQSRIANDIGGIETVVTSTATSVLANVTTVLATVVAMVLLDWRLAAFSLALLPLFVWLTKRVGEQRKKVTAERQASLADVSSIVQESLSVSGILLGKTMGRADDLAERFEQESGRLAALEVKSRMTGRWMMAAIQTSFAVMPALVYWFAGFTIAQGGATITIGTLVAFTTLQTRLFFPIGGPARSAARGAQLARALRPHLRVPRSRGGHRRGRQGDRKAARRGAARLGLVPRTRTGPGRSRTSRSSCRRGRRPRSSEKPAQARRRAPTSSRGSTTRPAGASRSTASTCASSRSIPSRRRSASSRRRRTCSMRPCARTSASRSPTQPTRTSRKPLEQRQIHDLVASLPDGYDTVVGERGYRFSGGERQRIAIARTILRNPPVLVLDEATSSLDTQTERLVQSALERLSEGRTTIAIAHRLSTVEDADQIVVLDHGRIVEVGTYAELVARGGRFAVLAAREELVEPPAVAAVDAT